MHGLPCLLRKRSSSACFGTTGRRDPKGNRRVKNPIRQSCFAANACLPNNGARPAPALLPALWADSRRRRNPCRIVRQRRRAFDNAMKTVFQSESAPVAKRCLLHQGSDFSFAAPPVALRRGFALAASRSLTGPSFGLGHGTLALERLRKQLAHLVVCLLGSVRIPAPAIPGRWREFGSSTERSPACHKENETYATSCTPSFESWFR